MFDDDFLEYIIHLNNHEVEYVLIGGLAVNIHGFKRSTGTMDVFVNITKENHEKLKRVHVDFRMPMGKMISFENFQNSKDYDVFRFGGGIYHIDVLTVCKGLDFEETYRASIESVFEGIKIRVVHLNQLIQAKEASGRYKDLEDVKQLKKKNGLD